MRTDEAGNPCPETLGEYRDLCDALGVEGNEALKLLDDKIAASPHGRDEKVLAADSQMRALLMPRLGRKKREWPIMAKRGRKPQFSAKECDDIRDTYNQPRESVSTTARLYKTSNSTVLKILSGTYTPNDAVEEPASEPHIVSDPNTPEAKAFSEEYWSKREQIKP